MDDTDNPDPGTEFTSESSWTLGSASDSFNYFFSNGRENSILSEFGWNLQSDEQARFAGQDRVKAEERSDLETNLEIQRSPGAPAGSSGGGTEVSTSYPSVSSSSSEDPTEKSTGSGGKPPEIPSPKVIKKKVQKRVRQPRFAFMTKSEVDHLEDGYRWRKYGQKSVKNSPFPRSYYRCTNSKCTVKKRVERSFEDPTIVITTYEGQHCHYTVGFPRAGGIISHEATFTSHMTPPTLQFYYPGMQLTRENPPSNVVQSQPLPVEASTVPTPSTTPQLPTDEGLLGDIVSPGMR